MKTTFFTALLALTVCGANAQNIFGREFSAINTQLVTPNLSINNTNLSAVANLQAASVYGNMHIYTGHDEFELGAGYNYDKATGYSNPEIYIARQGNDEGLSMSLIAGIYRVDSDTIQMGGKGRPMLDRKASYAGASLSYHFDENNYFGIIVRDVYDVAYTDGSDSVYYLFEAMTPTAFTNICVWNNNFETISLFGQYSYNAIEKSKYTASLEFKSDALKAGVFYSNEKPGAFLQYNFNRISVFASHAKETSIGIIIR